MHGYDYEILLRLALAAVLGAVIGFERERSQKPAGFRTQILICVASALLAGISVYVGGQYGVPQAEPARLMASIVAGIGFLGAGVIIKESSSHHISGVTTAATIWLSAAVGIAAGAGFFAEAIFCTLLVPLLYPLARFKHAAGISVENHSFIVDHKNWKRVLGMLALHDIDAEVWKMDGEKTYFRFSTTRHKGQKFAADLIINTVPFEVFGYNSSPQTMLG